MLHERYESVTYEAMRLGARALAAGRVEISVTGLENIPADGPVLLLARHYHHLFDGVVLLLSMPRPIHILVAVDWVKNRYARHLLTLATTMPRWPAVLRSDAPRSDASKERARTGKIFTPGAIRRYQRSAFSESVALLTEGRVLVVFPEGYPNVDQHYTPKTRPEEILPFKAGFAAITAAAEKRLGARVPIVPAGFRYTKNQRWSARLNIGKAVYAEDFVSRRVLVHRMEQRIAELSGLFVSGQQLNGGSVPGQKGTRDEAHRLAPSPGPR